MKDAADRAIVSGSSPMEVIRGLVARCEQLQRDKQQLQLQLAKVLGKLEKMSMSKGEAEEGAKGVVPSSSSSSSASSSVPSDSNKEDLLRELKVLRAENANMFWLQDENKRLKEELDKRK